PERVEPVAFAYRVCVDAPADRAAAGNMVRARRRRWPSWRSACYRRSAGGHGLAEKLIAEDAERAEYVDLPGGIVRIAAFRDGRIEACVFCGPAQNSPHWGVVRALFIAALWLSVIGVFFCRAAGRKVWPRPGQSSVLVSALGLEAIRRAITLG